METITTTGVAFVPPKPGNRAVKPAVREMVRCWILAGYTIEDVAIGNNLCELTIKRLNYAWNLEFGNKRLPRRWREAMRKRMRVPAVLEDQWLDFKRRETESPTPNIVVLGLAYQNIPGDRKEKWWLWMKARLDVRNKCWVLGQALKKIHSQKPQGNH